MSELKLLPCPFCGGKPVLLKHNDEDYYKVFCECCGARQWTFANRTDRDAIRNWNTRKPLDNIVEKLEEKAEFLKDCTKYGNKSAEQQEKSYSTMMMYEVADLVDDLIDIVKQEINNGLE